jgi:hypothetical protein
MRYALHLHPDCPRSSIRSIEADVTRSAPSGLEVRFLLAGDTRSLVLPLPSGQTRADGLWRHTCFELFLRPEGGDAYSEFNFSPSLQWAAYAFDSYRSGMRPIDLAPPRIEIRQDKTSLILQAVLALDRLAVVGRERGWNVALSAVIEETNGQFSHWALAHRAGKPDFHLPGGFVVLLPVQTM